MRSRRLWLLLLSIALAAFAGELRATAVAPAPEAPPARANVSSILLPTASAAPAAIELTIEAPPGLEGYERRVRNVDHQELARLLERAGLGAPPRVHLTLVPDADPRAGQVPSFVVGLARPPHHVIIFTDRVAQYPFGSVEATYRHEVVHLALFAAAGGQPLPRWFHEGVAVSVEGGWGFHDQARLLLAMAGRRPLRIADVEPLFESADASEAALAYRLSAALVDDVRRRAGLEAPGAIARRVGQGVPFAQAFLTETGELPDRAAERAWTAYRRWTRWIPAVTGAAAVWLAILALALVAFVARRRRSRRLRQRWEEEELRAGFPEGPPEGR